MIKQQKLVKQKKGKKKGEKNQHNNKIT